MDSNFANQPGIGELYFPGPGLHRLLFGLGCGPNLFVLCNCQWLPYTTHPATSVPRYLCMPHQPKPEVCGSVGVSCLLGLFQQDTPGMKKPLRALMKWKCLLCQKSIQLFMLLQMQIISNFMWYSS